jgi:hypothetical protein
LKNRFTFWLQQRDPDGRPARMRTAIGQVRVG